MPALQGFSDRFISHLSWRKNCHFLTARKALLRAERIGWVVPKQSPSHLVLLYKRQEWSHLRHRLRPMS